MYCVMWKNIRIFPNKIFPHCSKRSDVNVSLSQVRLKNAETLSDNLKRKSQKLQSSLKQSERKSSQLGFKLATAEVKIKFLEDQVCLLEKDLKREHMGTSDNLNDAIEVISLFQLSPSIIHSCCTYDRKTPTFNSEWSVSNSYSMNLSFSFSSSFFYFSSSPGTLLALRPPSAIHVL